MPRDGSPTFFTYLTTEQGAKPDSFPAARENWRITMLNPRACVSDLICKLSYLILSLFVIVDPKPYILSNIS